MKAQPCRMAPASFWAAEGIKVSLPAGRASGWCTEIARNANGTYRDGRVPFQDYTTCPPMTGHRTSACAMSGGRRGVCTERSYGIIGVKVWIYKVNP